MIEAFAADGFDVFPASESMLTRGLAIGAAGCISATVNVNPIVIQALYKSKGTDEMLHLQAKADEIRQIFQAAPMIPAMKRVMAEFTGQSNWQIVRPPLVQLTNIATKQLLEQLANAKFEMPGIALR